MKGRSSVSGLIEFGCVVIALLAIVLMFHRTTDDFAETWAVIATLWMFLHELSSMQLVELTITFLVLCACVFVAVRYTIPFLFGLTRKLLSSLFVLLLATCGVTRASDYDKVTAGTPSHEYVVINYDGQKIPDALEAMLRYNTTIRLPHGEKVMEVAAGDMANLQQPGSGEWIMQESAAQDAVYIRPTHQGIATNIEIRTDHGNRYSLFINDHSLDKGAHLHLEYIINPTGQAQLEALKGPAKWVLAEKLDDAVQRVNELKIERDELEQKWQRKFTTAQDETRQQTLTHLVCDYDVAKAVKEFGIQNVCHDQDWAYLWAKGAREHFALADMSSGSAIMIVPDFDPEAGMYSIHTIPKKIRLTVGDGKKMHSVDVEQRNATKKGV